MIFLLPRERISDGSTHGKLRDNGWIRRSIQRFSKYLNLSSFRPERWRREGIRFEVKDQA